MSKYVDRLEKIESGKYLKHVPEYNDIKYYYETKNVYCSSYEEMIELEPNFELIEVTTFEDKSNNKRVFIRGLGDKGDR